jgi:predicted GH43/DUF377 family glycosyl hydrolase
VNDIGLARRSPVRLEPRPDRVVTRLFVAGQELVGGGEGRASDVVARILALDEASVVEQLDELLARFAGRHRDLVGSFRHHAHRIENRLGADDQLSDARWLLLGASFTHEYSIEAAALCNPSIVAHPDQSGVPAGSLRFVMTVRGIGEGHRSSIGFRTGTVAAEGTVVIDAPGCFAEAGNPEPEPLDRLVLHAGLEELGIDGESAAWVLGGLDARFTIDQLDGRLRLLETQSDTRDNAFSVAAHVRAIASCSYRTTFSDESTLAERVLTPAMPAEANGLEDARLVRFTEDDGTVTHYATYTAFDGHRVSQQLLQTDDFAEFTSMPLVGPAAADKGMALFPRRIAGRAVALSRHDRQTNALAFSDTLARWEEPTTIQVPRRGWEVVQLGNCGPPIETDAGWLVLTHGVGPMRTYTIGAILLDLDDPTKVLGELPLPLLAPTPDERDGYVPNVVYSCGSLVHGDLLVVPFGISDTAIGFATAEVADVLDAMVG